MDKKVTDELYKYIFKRKSIRKYEMVSLSEDTIAKVNFHLENLEPLYKDIKIGYKIVGQEYIKSLLPVKAPHYLVISSEEKEGFLENVGFMFQQMDLHFSSMGLGSCWLGMARTNEEIETELPFVIVMAFGKPKEEIHRETPEFKRNGLSQISSGKDKRIEVVRLAPSSTNSQNWYFAAEDGKIHVYRTKLSLLKLRIYEKMNQIDIGIAICFLWLSCLNYDKTFDFVRLEHPPERKGFTYVGTVGGR
ncbi:MAG: nitroreductase family protein [Proteocatella sp.]